MPHLNYHYKIKKADRNNYQAQFMIPAENWIAFKDQCSEQGITPSQNLEI